MNRAAFAHATGKITIGGCRAYLTVCQNTIAHTQASPAGGVCKAKSGIHKYTDKALVQRLTVNFLGSRGHDRPD